MSDEISGKKSEKNKLPLLDSELLPLVPDDRQLKLSTKCFAFNSQQKPAVGYYLRGLAELHKGYWAAEDAERMKYFNNAFGLFHLARGFDRNFYCAREALSHVAGLLGMEMIEGGERYANSLSAGPLMVSALHDESGDQIQNKAPDQFPTKDNVKTNRNNNDYSCHLMHPGMYSASDLEKLTRNLK